MAFLLPSPEKIPLAGLNTLRQQNTDFVVRALLSSGRKLSVAESCTGGLLAYSITSVPGASGCFDYGIVAYSNDVKTRELSVPEDVLLKYGAVSRETAYAMAGGVRKKGKADFGIGITGIAGPAGGTAEKPVGLVYIGVASEDKVFTEKLLVQNQTREYVRQYAAMSAMQMLKDIL